MNKICFYHHHVNGDCYLTRIFVNHIVKHTKHINNMEYFYTAPRSLNSYAYDLSVNDCNFNKLNLLHNSENVKLYLDESNKILFINVWIGFSPFEQCVFCLKNIITYFNSFIQDINRFVNIDIPSIEENYPYLPFNYPNDVKELIHNYITTQQTRYKKIISLFNIRPTTFVNLGNINYSYLLIKIAQKYPDYLFIPFNEVDNQQLSSLPNVISFQTICEKNNFVFSVNNGIAFTYLTSITDKIIGCGSGFCQMSFNDELKNITNKYLFIHDSSPSGNPGNCPTCNNYNLDGFLCTKKYGLFINVCNYEYSDELLLDKIDNFIELPIQKI